MQPRLPFPDLTPWIAVYWPAGRRALRTAAAWLSAAWQEGQAELAGDLQDLAEPVRQGVNRLPFDQAAGELRSGLSELRTMLAEAGAALAEDGQVLVDALRAAYQRWAQTRVAARWRAVVAACRPLAAQTYRQAQTGLAAGRDWLVPRARAGAVWVRRRWAHAPQTWRTWAGGQWDRAQHQARAGAAWIHLRWKRAPQTWRAWTRRPEFLHYLVLADGALAASIVATLAVSAPALDETAFRQPRLFQPAAAHANGRQPTPLPNLTLPTETWTPTLAPSPTPLLTATPIPSLYTEWQSSLPLYGGWNGVDQCWGGVLAPVGTGQFIWPTAKHYLVGYNYRYGHPGLDLGGDVGDPLYAADAGVVVYAGWNIYGYGNLVIIDHGNGWHTLYAHMSEIHVTCGQDVLQGAVIGLAGSTGHSTGPHLHFEMRLNGEYVSPWDYLPAP